MLKSIKLNGVGPVPNLAASFGERLNLVTGDNGLGKSFFLDVCFWTLTGAWPGGRTAIPDASSKATTIGYEVQCGTKSASREAKYNFKTQGWSRQKDRPSLPGLVIYAAVDGSFAVWDPARNHSREPKAAKNGDGWPRPFQFSPASPSEYVEGGTRRRTIRQDVANGLEEESRVLCNGLIADWANWYYQRTSSSSGVPSPTAFGLLEAVIAQLSHPLEPLQCEAEPRKVFLDDIRQFPVLRMPYGAVPYPHWSAGVKRVASFAYLIVWAWVEHLQAVELRKEDPTDRIILIVDEIEAHLHPKWQRTILPAILTVVNKLKANISVQVHAATHSPLVLASLEPLFDEEKDRLFWFDLQEKTVAFREFVWAKYGDVGGWLTSPIFDLKQARSREAEQVIEAAKAFLRDDQNALPAGLKTKAKIDHRLRELLDGQDPFLVRWHISTEENHK